tara:strand:+ start:180 stop:1298 length:1119 start_codon:yes stop_codon:yes gene_type:complete
MNNNFWQEKNILITGHTGFKGSWLTLWLLMLGARVNGFSLEVNNEQKLYKELFLENSKNLENLSGTLNHHEGDINNFYSLKNFIQDVKPEIVFHLAAEPLVIDSYKSPLKTWNTNVIGSLNLLESLKNIDNACSAIFITTDKVYKNKEWFYGYRENDELGGRDPYSASKAAMEIAISSYRESFCGNYKYQNPNLLIASARAGNVIGGGDWAQDRLVPDIVRSLSLQKNVLLRNPKSIRPWQHVLDPLCGYLCLAKKLYQCQLNKKEDKKIYASSFNFGPNISSSKTVEELVRKFLIFWDGDYKIDTGISEYYEANTLNLISDKAIKYLGWRAKWDFEKTIKRTADWYSEVNKGASPFIKCSENIREYSNETF